MSTGASNTVTVQLKPHFRGYFHGIVKSDRLHRVFFEARNPKAKKSERPDWSATFTNRNQKEYLRDTSNQRDHYSFSTGNRALNLEITIENAKGKGDDDDDDDDDGWMPSKIGGPFELHKEPEDDLFPIEFYQTTITSEVGDVIDYNDCTIVIVQYKDGSKTEKK